MPGNVDLVVADSKGNPKGSVSKGTLELRAGSGVWLDAQQTGVVGINSGITYTSDPYYQNMMDNIIAGAGAYTGFKGWVGSIGGATPNNGAIGITGDVCMAVGGVDKKGVLDPLLLKDSCPPCVDCWSFRQGDGSPTVDVPDETDPTKTTQVAIEGLFDLIERLSAAMTTHLSGMLGYGGILDKYKQLVDMYNYVVHRRSYACSVDMYGRSSHASFRYTNQSDQLAGFRIDIEFPKAPEFSKAAFIDASTTKGTVISHEDDFAGRGYEMSHYVPPKVSVYGVLDARETLVVHTACFIPNWRNRVDKLPIDVGSAKFSYYGPLRTENVPEGTPMYGRDPLFIKTVTPSPVNEVAAWLTDYPEPWWKA